MSSEIREIGGDRRGRLAASIIRTAVSVIVLGLPLGAKADTWSNVYRGTLGPHRIGAQLDVRDGTHFAGGHYFYDDKGVDIPLTGSNGGSELTLSESGGGVFHLHFVDKGRSAPDLNFGTSTGLRGTWTRGTASYPVVLDLNFATLASDRARYADVTRASDASFEAMVRRFVHGVAGNDRIEAASAIHFPLRINQRNGKPVFIETRARLLQRWPQVFSPAYAAKIRDVSTHDLMVRNGQAMIGDGEAWFDADGAVSINPPIRR